MVLYRDFKGSTMALRALKAPERAYKPYEALKGSISP